MENATPDMDDEKALDMGEAGLRSCDECDRVTDGGAWPDWVNGVCELCDPSLLDDIDPEPLQL